MWQVQAGVVDGKALAFGFTIQVVWLLYTVLSGPDHIYQERQINMGAVAWTCGQLENQGGFPC